MKAAVLYGPGDIRVEERAIPVPGNDEVLIKVRACGVCGTDNALNKGDYPATYPVVIGHEFSGEVVEKGSRVTRFSTGDRVTVDPNRVCHRCFYCQSGLDHLCDNLSSMGVHIDGADAEYCVMTQDNVYSFGSHLTWEEAAFTEPLACAVHGVDLSGIRVGDTVLVVGAGGMGNLIAQCARNSGAVNVVISEPIFRRREVALENGATHALNPTACDVASEIRKIKPTGADVVFEVAGNLRAQADCLSYVRKGGTVVYFGVSPKDGTTPISPFFVNENEIRILGSFNNRAATARAVEMLSAHIIRVDNLISHRYPLERYPDALSDFGGHDTIKLMVSPDRSR